jgi:PRC-barrel domain
MPAFDVARRWKGRVVLDRTGDKLGSVLDVFYDAENDEPGWVLLGTADAAAGTRLVPVAKADDEAGAVAQFRGLPPD